MKKWLQKNEKKIHITFLILSFLSIVLSLLMQWDYLPNFIFFDPSFIAIILCGLPIVIGAFIGVIKNHDITADLLVSIALIGSLILKEWFAAGEVAFIMQIGSLLEEITSSKAEKGIKKLLKISPKKATVLKDNIEYVIDVEQVQVGDILRVKAGESIPVDGIILEGSTSVDQSSMTGESIPVFKNKGDSLMSGTLNQNGAFLMKATKTAENSALQRMIRLAKSSDAQKAKIVRKANHWASWLVVISLTTALVAGTIIGFIHHDFWLGFSRAITILVVFCPCAFVLATPTAISAGIGNASFHGILIQSGEALERISETSIAVFDKTGTLTEGKPSVKKIDVLGILDEKELLKIAASGETLSNHPLAKAIVSFYHGPLYVVENHQTINGWGISFSLHHHSYKMGKIENAMHNDSHSKVGIYQDEKLIGIIYIEDKVKENALQMVEELHSLGKKVIMLTGDNNTSAQYVAEALKLDEYHANCTPEDKLSFIIQKENQGQKVIMFGDGVNDSLALRKAYASIAMGNIGSDVAIESADAVIVHDNLDAIPYLFYIAKKTQKRITVNLCISMVLNFIAVVLSIIGILNTVWGALFHNCGSVAVVISAFLLLFTKKNK